MFGPSRYRFAKNVVQIPYQASLLLLAVVSLSVSGCGDKNSAPQPGAAPQAMPVQVQVAATEKIPDTTEYLSQLKSRHSAIINPQVEGQITKIFVKSGDRVTTGQVLLEIDPLKQQATVSGQEASRAAAEASMQLAKTNLDRAKRLYEAGVIPKQDLDNAQASYASSAEQVKALKEQVNQERVQLNYYRVSAPMSGIVGDIPVRMGDRVMVTTLLTTVDEPGALETYIYVPADRAKDLKPGLPVKLLDVAGQALADTKISFVSPQVDLDTQTVLAKAPVPNSRATLRMSQQVRAQITWGVHEGPVIPILAVSRINGQFFAFVATSDGKGATAHQKILKLGDTVGNNYAVLDGLKAGDHIIISGTQFLQDGFPVAEQIQGAGAASPPGAGASH